MRVSRALTWNNAAYDPASKNDFGTGLISRNMDNDFCTGQISKITDTDFDTVETW